MPPKLPPNFFAAPFGWWRGTTLAYVRPPLPSGKGHMAGDDNGCPVAPLPAGHGRMRPPPPLLYVIPPSLTPFRYVIHTSLTIERQVRQAALTSLQMRQNARRFFYV